nr:MAG TPA: hypothetical protein [Caudoviricetes sp.]
MMQKHQMKHNTIKDKKIYFPYLFILEGLCH